MNYKKTLFFIGKCLTISLESKNKEEIELILKTRNVDWDAVVKVSTAHYVLPALYCNFKRTDFLKYLPADLVDYMLYITNINRDRNTKIFPNPDRYIYELIETYKNVTEIELINAFIPEFETRINQTNNETIR